MSNEDVRSGRIDAFILLADKAERLIGEALARVAGSDAPNMDEAYGEINMAYRLELIDYPRRDVLVAQLREVVACRRAQLRKERIERILGEKA